MNVKVRKMKKASVSYWDRGAEVRTPATYGVFVDDVQVGYIYAREVGYMEDRQWEILDIDSRPLHRPYPAKFKNAKEWAINHDWRSHSCESTKR